VDRFPIRSDSIRLGKTPPTRTQKKDLSNGGALVLSYLEVERAVHAVLLRPEDARQVFRHDDDDDERRIYIQRGKIWSIKKVANYYLLGEKIRVKRDTHTLLSKGLARASKKQRGVGSFESIEKRQTRAFFERFERTLDRKVEEDTQSARLKKSTSSFGSKNAA